MLVGLELVLLPRRDVGIAIHVEDAFILGELKLVDELEMMVVGMEEADAGGAEVPGDEQRPADVMVEVSLVEREMIANDPAQRDDRLPRNANVVEEHGV
jgi:hypothetical protein